MAGVDGVVAVFLSQAHKLHTTRSWDFIGFSHKAKRSRVESDIILRIFDTGIWPKSGSFDDKGFDPPLVKWKGTCHVSSNFTCSNYNIDQHDYSVRLKAARIFLKDGDKVKVIGNLKGRENEFRNIAIELIKRFQNDIGELGTEESKNFRDRNIARVMVPNKAILQKAQEPPKKKDNSTTESEVSASV